MYVKKHFKFREILNFSGGHLIWISVWVCLVTIVYYVSGWKWMNIPWLPVSVIGTAVAFYLGFKNNQAYDRLWEARKIWGGIVNTSRAWGSSTSGFVTNIFNENPISEQELKNIIKNLIYRQIAWLYTLRQQLLVPTQWEHISQNKHVSKTTERRMRNMGARFMSDVDIENIIKSCVSPSEFKNLGAHKNAATQLIFQQAETLKELRTKNIIDDFRHMELQKLLNDLYEHQGKCERIKKFPLPRQYGSMSFVFVGIFIFLLPFATLNISGSLGFIGYITTFLLTVLISWIYIMMELIGDYSENPFEGLGNDIPMLSLCRTIEIDLRQMLGEKELPEAIEPVNGVLM